jgi:hypothetical protein
VQWIVWQYIKRGPRVRNARRSPPGARNAIAACIGRINRCPVQEPLGATCAISDMDSAYYHLEMRAWWNAPNRKLLGRDRAAHGIRISAHEDASIDP